MENENFHGYFTGLLSSLKTHFIAISIACIGLMLISYGLISSFMPKTPEKDILFETAGQMDNDVKKIDTEKGKIAIDVSGGVVNPGVYRLLENARVEEAIVAAGGFADDADLDWTQHSLNLAAKVSDGMKIYIPRQGESAEQTTELSGSFVSSGQGVVAGASTNGLVSVNTASGSELETLPGVGPVTATKIMDHRPYGSIDELLSKKAVGNGVFEKIKDLISL